MLQVMTSRFGLLRVPADRLLHFPHGLCGFEDKHSFFILEQEGTGGRLRWLQSCDDGSLAFLVTAPHFFWPEYRPSFQRSDLNALGLERAEDGVLLAILTVPGSLKRATANLRAPLLLNEATRQGGQLLCLEEYATRQPLGQSLIVPEEVAHAGAHAASR